MIAGFQQFYTNKSMLCLETSIEKKCAFNYEENTFELKGNTPMC